MPGTRPVRLVGTGRGRRPDRHSVRRATTGSSRPARRAGSDAEEDADRGRDHEREHGRPPGDRRRDRGQRGLSASEAPTPSPMPVRPCNPVSAPRSCSRSSARTSRCCAGGRHHAPAALVDPGPGRSAGREAGVDPAGAGSGRSRARRPARPDTGRHYANARRAVERPQGVADRGRQPALRRGDTAGGAGSLDDGTATTC